MQMIMPINNEGVPGTVAGLDDKPLRGILGCKRGGGRRERERERNRRTD
jgi:hypothetical protein